MTLKYHYTFKGLDDAINRVEIYTRGSGVSKEVTATGDPFIIEYPEVKKLEVVQGSGAKIGLISTRVFEFVDLHTDNAQDYLVKFYRNQKLFWLGWLDSELYDENLSQSPPYETAFSVSDFNTLDRIKYQTPSEEKYTDIASIFEHIKRCLRLLDLPFEALCIGCSTVLPDIPIEMSETILHKLFVQSANFYDEDGKPMSCKEVIESVLMPFGLVMVQKDAKVYIYDYNTLKSRSAMKRYDFDTMEHDGHEVVFSGLGDMLDIGFLSADSTFGFEEMYNNVKITGSIYADTSGEQYGVEKDKLSDLISSETVEVGIRREVYGKCESWTNDYRFVCYENTRQSYKDRYLIGADGLKRDSVPANTLIYTVPFLSEYITRSYESHFITINMKAFVNTKKNPFREEEKESDEDKENKKVSHVLLVNAWVYITDEAGNRTHYYVSPTSGHIEGEWLPVNQVDLSKRNFELCFLASEIESRQSILNSWVTLKNIDIKIDDLGSGDYRYQIAEKGYTFEGRQIPIPEGLSGYITMKIMDMTNIYGFYEEKGRLYVKGKLSASKVVDILYDSLSLKITDKSGNEVKIPDIEFNSYINKRVLSDYPEIALTTCSANENKYPVGKGCILKKESAGYGLQLLYLRAGQIDILERLLMCTVHSNYSQKNRVIGVDLKMTDNPMLLDVTYRSVFGSSAFLVLGAILDFKNAKTTIKVSDYSEDNCELSSVPYE